MNDSDMILDPRVELVRDNVANHMDDIVRQFKPGAQIAVIVYHPDNPGWDFMLTSVAPSEIIKVCERRLADAGR